MPILWRYLIKNYLQVFLLGVTAFIAILLTSRLEEIAHFASFGAEGKLVLLFALLQVPYILPIAVPVACLISSILLMQRLSKDHELTAIRSSGFSLKEICAPLIFSSLFLSLFNFYTVSELATLGHLQSNLLKNELRSVNPLLLLHNKYLLRVKGIYYEALGPSKMGQSASQVLIAMPSEKQHALNLIMADKLVASDSQFTTEKLTLFTPTSSSKEGFQNTLIESFDTSRSSITDFSHLIQKKITQINHDNLNMRLLLVRLRDLKNEAASSKEIRLIYADIARRISAGLSPFIFTLMGLAFGITISRSKKSSQLLFPIGLAAIYLICFFAAKSLGNQIFLVSALYLIPQLLIILISLRKMQNISHGVGA